MKAQDLLGPFRLPRELINAQGRGIRGHDAVRLHDAVQLAKDRAFQFQILEHSLNNQVRAVDVLVIPLRPYSIEPLGDHGPTQSPALNRRIIILTNREHACF